MESAISSYSFDLSLCRVLTLVLLGCRLSEIPPFPPYSEQAVCESFVVFSPQETSENKAVCGEEIQYITSEQYLSPPLLSFPLWAPWQQYF